MNFLKKLFGWDSDSNGFEIAITILVPLVVAFLLGWLIVASYGVGHTSLARAADLARPNSKFWGTVLYVAAGVWAWANWTHRIPFKVNDIVATIILCALIVLGVNACTGFFTASH